MLLLAGRGKRREYEREWQRGPEGEGKAECWARASSLLLGAEKGSKKYITQGLPLALSINGPPILRSPGPAQNAPRELDRTRSAACWRYWNFGSQRTRSLGASCCSMRVCPFWAFWHILHRQGSPLLALTLRGRRWTTTRPVQPFPTRIPTCCGKWRPLPRVRLPAPASAFNLACAALPPADLRRASRASERRRGVIEAPPALHPDH